MTKTFRYLLINVFLLSLLTFTFNAPFVSDAMEEASTKQQLEGDELARKIDVFLEALEKTNPTIILDKDELKESILFGNLEIKNEEGLKFFPPEIGELVNLTYVDLSGASIEELPSTIGELVNLTYLNLSDTKIKELPSQIEKLENLELLNLSGTEIIKFPVEIIQLMKLKELYLDRTQITTLPAVIKNLKNLKTLGLPSDFKVSFDEILVFLKDPENRDYTEINNDEIVNFLETSSVVENYLSEISNFYSLIYSDLPKITGKFKSDSLSSSRPQEIIFNQNNYDKDVKLPRFNNFYKEGKELRLEKGTAIKNTDTETYGSSHYIPVEEDVPVGYNIYVPKGDIKAVIVIVYGGYNIEQRTKKMKKPNPTDYFIQNLLSKGIAVVELNLVNLLKLSTAQSNMPLDTHNELHGSINRFFQALKQADENLHPDLKNLIGKKVYLYGASYGGRTALRHAELYPDTFDGYISHDGGISPMVWSDYSPWIMPMTKNKDSDIMINEIKQPILLLHNFDDNNVNIKATLDWYNKAKKIGKGGLVQLFISREGNSLSKATNTSSTIDLIEKGHFLPEKEVYKDYINAITSFILKGLGQLPSVRDWKNTYYDIYANKNFKSATLNEKFISEAFRIYWENTSTPNEPLWLMTREKVQKQIMQDWQDKYRPIYYLISDQEKYKQQTKEFNEKFNSQAEIEQHAKILPAKVSALQEKGMLSNERIANALKKQLPVFLTYLKEIGKIKGTSDVSKTSDNGLKVPENIIKLSNNKTLQKEFLFELLDPNTDNDLKLRFLYEYYMGNLDLMKNIMPSSETEEEIKAQNELIDAIMSEREKMLSVWKKLIEKSKLAKNG